MCCDLPSLRARYLLHLSMSYHKFQLTSRGHLPLETGMSNPLLLPLLLAGLVYSCLFACQSIVMWRQLKQPPLRSRRLALDKPQVIGHCTEAYVNCYRENSTKQAYVKQMQDVLQL